MRKYNIAIIGPTFYGNKGAAAMLTSGIQNLDSIIPVNKFYVFSYYPKDDKKINPYPKAEVFSATPKNLILRLFPYALIYKLFLLLCLPTKRFKKNKEIRALIKADVLIDMAGVSFIDGREKYLPFNILSIWPAMLLGTSVVKYSQALGPFNNPINRLASKIFLPKLSLIVARGKKTGKHLKDLGLKNVILCADGGFSLKIKKKDQEFSQKFKKKNESFFKKEIVGITPSSVVSDSCHKNDIDYEKVIAHFSKHLINKNYNILLIPHSIRKNTQSTRNNDLPICLRIAKLVGNNKNCMTIDEELSPQELKSVIALSSLFIASRFHSMISSLSSGIPTLVCGWSHKYREVLDMFGLGDYAFSYQKLDLEILEKNFRKLEKDKNIIISKIKTKLPSVKQSSLKQIKAIKSLLEA